MASRDVSSFVFDMSVSRYLFAKTADESTSI